MRSFHCLHVGFDRIIASAGTLHNISSSSSECSDDNDDDDDERFEESMSALNLLGPLSLIFYMAATNCNDPVSLNQYGLII